MRTYQEQRLDYFIEPDTEYTVYGLEWHDDDTWFLVANISGYLEAVPAMFFTVLDGHLSRNWVLTVRGRAAFMYPEEIARDADFLDRLSDLEPSYVLKWARLRRELDDEALTAGR